jgi:hypothetical protein
MSIMCQSIISPKSRRPYKAKKRSPTRMYVHNIKAAKPTDEEEFQCPISDTATERRVTRGYSNIKMMRMDDLDAMSAASVLANMPIDIVLKDWQKSVERLNWIENADGQYELKIFPAGVIDCDESSGCLTTPLSLRGGNRGTWSYDHYLSQPPNCKPAVYRSDFIGNLIPKSFEATKELNNYGISYSLERLDLPKHRAMPRNSKANARKMITECIGMSDDRRYKVQRIQ